MILFIVTLFIAVSIFRIMERLQRMSNLKFVYLFVYLFIYLFIIYLFVCCLVDYNQKNQSDYQVRFSDQHLGL